MKRVKMYIKTHKIISTIGVLLALGGGYWGYQKLTSTSGETRYVVATAQKDTIIISVSGTGQVSASNQIDLKPKASGDIIYIGAVNGEEIQAGSLVIQLDAETAQKTVRDAEVNLESAQLSLEKLQKPADNLSLIQAENSLARAKESKQNAIDDLQKVYEDGFNNISNAFLTLPAIMTGLQDILYSNNAGLGGVGQSNADYYAGAVAQYDTKVNQYKADADIKYQAARAAYDKNFLDYKTTNRSSDTGIIDSLINQTYETTKNIAEAVKSGNNLIQFYKDKLTERNIRYAPLADTQLASLTTYTSETNTFLLNLLAAENAVKNDKDAMVNADRSITENTESLTKLKAGADQFDIDSAQLSVRQRQNALLDARENLANYFLRAPFGGTIAKMNAKKSDAVSNGTVIATLITKQKLAEISLNEVDVAKIKIGQKVTLTFDAVSGLNITGIVAEIDSIGTVTQGVVTYNIKISFDTQDDRVKPGMSVSAAIITDIKQDVLAIPNNAVKSRGDTRYVEIFDSPLLSSASTQNNQGIPSTATPRQQPIEIGISNDTQTEITSGLKEGDQVIVRIITASTQATPSAPSLFSAPRGGGVAGRALGR